MDEAFYISLIAPIAGALGMLVVAYLAWSIKREEAGTPRMREIANYIQEGANAFLKRQYKTIIYFIIILAALMAILGWSAPSSHLGWETALAFIYGAVMSLLAAYIGMNVAVRANVRTANAARKSPEKALTIAFRGGAVMGISVVSLSLIGISTLYYAFGNPELLVGYGFGASLAALFAQLGGGIYTKAADIGADLVGKVEAKIPEDDPRNPAVIADQVGDNVGDCAGRGADLFESFSDNIICAMILSVLFAGFSKYAVVFPLVTQAIGIIATIIGVSLVKGWKGVSPIKSFNIGLFVTGIICAVGFYVSSVCLLNEINIFYSALAGLIASLVVGVVAQYYTGAGMRPVKKIAEASQRGPAINIIIGLAYGLQSAFIPVVTIAAVIAFSYYIAGFYGVAAATLGILSMTGIIMSSDTFGPISDNADGIAEMSGIKDEVGESLEALDAMGNTTKALTKAYAMACAGLSAIVIFVTYLQIVGLLTGPSSFQVINLIEPRNIVGLFIGAILPFLFSALAIGATGKTAFMMVDEVRRQFREIKGLLEGKAKPDYARCVDISTKNALKEMVVPTLIGIISPIVVGLLLGKEALGALLLGQTASVIALAPFFINVGGAWDNAKKYVEAGHFGGKGTETHAAAVVGDTVGDPLKDVAGPSLHIFTKLINMTALVFAPVIVAYALL
ncbi:sodium-translocating pyrophosphatase [Candidatus Bathyarchaeota archaeon]|nr:MAG: sodium-translocating pyrophosphatase [Candidatus Bathyarchaeota archaeon]